MLQVLTTLQVLSKYLRHCKWLWSCKFFGMRLSKRMDFWKVSKRTRGMFPIKKLYCKCPFILRIYLIVKLYQNAQISMSPQKSAIMFSENEGGEGDQRPFGTFRKIHLFWKPDPSLRLTKRPMLLMKRFFLQTTHCHIISIFTFFFLSFLAYSPSYSF